MPLACFFVVLVFLAERERERVRARRRRRRAFGGRERARARRHQTDRSIDRSSAGSDNARARSPRGGDSPHLEVVRRHGCLLWFSQARDEGNVLVRRRVLPEQVKTIDGFASPATRSSAAVVVLGVSRTRPRLSGCWGGRTRACGGRRGAPVLSGAREGSSFLVFDARARVAIENCVMLRWGG